MKKLLVIILLFLSFSTHAQLRIRGKVVDKDSNKSLYNVSIYVKGKSVGTVTKSNGKFELTLPKRVSKSDSLVFSRIDYATVSFLIGNIVSEPQKILMKKKTINLEAVNLKSKVDRRSNLKFEKLSSMKKAVYAFASIINNEKLYVFGGDKSTYKESFKEAAERANASSMSPTFRDIQRYMNPGFSQQSFESAIQIYDFVKDEWIVSNLKLKKRAYHHVSWFKNEFYLFGGKRISGKKRNEYLENEVEIIDLDSTKVSIDQSNPHKAVNFASVTYKDYFLSLGGSVRIKKNGDKVFNDNIHAYHFTSGYWYNLGKLPEPMESSAISLNDKLYLIGGFNGKISDRISMFNIETGGWKNIGQLFYPIEFPALTSNGNSIYIYDAGKIIVFDTTKKTIVQYDIKLPLRRASIHYFKDKLYIIGGYMKNQYSSTASKSIYSIDLIEFNKTKPSLFKQL